MINTYQLNDEKFRVPQRQETFSKKYLLSDNSTCLCGFIQNKQRPKHLKRYKTYQNCLSNHLQGLPSYINIPFYYCDIIELAKKLGSLPEKATEKQENKICTNYFNYMSAKLIQWARKHKVNLF
jgi:hypothetical protein